jgi:hypothetical protein
MHIHTRKEETYYVIEGELTVYDDESEVVLGSLEKPPSPLQAEPTARFSNTSISGTRSDPSSSRSTAARATIAAAFGPPPTTASVLAMHHDLLSEL